MTFRWYLENFYVSRTAFGAPNENSLPYPPEVEPIFANFCG